MNKNTTNFALLFEKAFHRDFPSDRILETLTPLLVFGTSIVSFRADDFIIYSESPVDKLYLLLKGTYQIEKYSTEGRRGVIKCPDILLGLYEITNGDLTYGAFVRCTTPCLCLVIDASLFKKQLKENIIVSNIAVEHLSELIKLYMIRSEQHIIMTDYQFFIHYLYQASESQSFPYKLPISRRTLSDTLGINLRTLYRYVDRAVSNNFLTLSHGKIIIDQSQHLAQEDFLIDIGI